jgi:hypothetical protein
MRLVGRSDKADIMRVEMGRRDPGIRYLQMAGTGGKG